jgi:putative ABC transport system permease protein
MRTVAAHYVYRGLRNLRRSPSLTAMIAFSIAFGMAALLAAFAWWRATSGNPIWQNSEPLYVVQTDPRESTCTNYG